MDLQVPLRPVHWIGSSLDDLKEMPEEVRDDFGYALFQVQDGGRPQNATPLQGFAGAGVMEIRENFDGDTYRCIYTVRFAQAVYVLHAFMKKSHRGRTTPKHDIDLVKDRLKTAEEDYKVEYGVQAGRGRP